MNHRFIFLLLICLLTSFFVSCASTPEGEDEKVSTLPWNKPAKWEGQGPAGSFLGGRNGAGY